MTDKEIEINESIQFAPQDKLMRIAFLWMIPRCLLPNHFTILRFVMCPLVFWFVYTQSYTAALVLFIIAAFTDAIDGSMARTRKQITLWGTMYDGVADKLLIVGVLIILVLSKLGGMAAGMIIGIEMLTVVVAFYYKRKGVICQANWWGKIKMNLQVIAIICLLINILGGVHLFKTISIISFSVSIGFAFFSIIAHARAFTST